MHSTLKFVTGTHRDRDCGLEPHDCHLLCHLYAWTTLDFQGRGLDGAGRDGDEYKRASAARTFRHILMNCSRLLLTLTSLRQRVLDPLPEVVGDQRDFCSVLVLFCGVALVMFYITKLFCIVPQSDAVGINLFCHVFQTIKIHH